VSVPTVLSVGEINRQCEQAGVAGLAEEDLEWLVLSLRAAQAGSRPCVAR
jgi:hypothetical protein